MSPAPIERWLPGAAVEDFTAAVFAGRLISFRSLRPLQDLVDRVRHIVADVFGTADLMRAEQMLDPDEFRALAVRARAAVGRDAGVNSGWRDCLTGIGFDAESVHRDRMRLRVVASAAAADGRVIRPLPAHRDTWGSGIAAQINWWLPLHTLSATRTLLVWPELFRQPVKNDSDEWNYDAVRDKPGYPLLPTVRELPATAGRPVLIEPGELLAFSAAQLHAGVADDSGYCRFSVDTRTIWSADIAAGRGAPNVDSATRQQRWEWFERPEFRSVSP